MITTQMLLDSVHNGQLFWLFWLNVGFWSLVFFKTCRNYGLNEWFTAWCWFFGVTLLLLGGVGSFIGNAVVSERHGVSQFISKIEELPIQTLEYRGEQIDVVVARNSFPAATSLSSSRLFHGINVLRVNDVLPVNPREDTRLWLVTERTRYFWIWLIIGREIITPINPYDEETIKEEDRYIREISSNTRPLES